jgi:muramoyltetrapeptide carboxypeptidase
MILSQGATIGITCPSGYVAAERTAYCTHILQQWGFNVVIGATVGRAHNYFAGTDQERIADLQQMLDDPNIDALLMGRGGYGMSRIIDQLDFTEFLKKPKWICGFSDITLILSHIQARFGLPALHSPMCGHFKPETEFSDQLLSFRRALTGQPQIYSVPPGSFNKTGSAEGVLTGGNLSMFVHLTGSVSEVNTEGKILFLEDIGEHYYMVDRMMMHLKRAGKLSGLAGLILGGFSDMQDTERPFGQTVEALIMDKVSAYNYPVCFNFPAGHQEVNYTLALGVRHRLEVTEQGVALTLLSSNIIG